MKIRTKKTSHSVITFKKNALMSLSVLDQKKFESYGGGGHVKVPYECIHHAFEDYVKVQPHAIAVEHAGKKITYKELNDKANLVAQNLIKHGVQAKDHVGLFMTRSIDLVAGMLGTLKVGAAYVPQDVRILPKAQLEYIKDKANLKVVLSVKKYGSNLPKKTKTIYIDALERLAETSFQSYRIGSQTTCFILFTSGTTGEPNGVQVTHKNLTNVLLTSPGNLGIVPGMKVSQILNISFDLCAWEILGTLSNGGAIFIREKSIQETIEKVNVVISTPTILSKIDSEKCTQLQTVAVAGEPCSKSLADLWSKKANFYNCCGPTETTIVNTMHEYLGSDHPISIGSPTPNNTVYVLDDNLKPLPIGEIGEVWAGGPCVTAGYVGNPDLNKERYLEDPFIEGQMFRTRDLGRWNENGELEHYGRTDDQVKIRGFRVELDSISSVLEMIPGITRAVTIKLNDRDLASFVVCEDTSLMKIYKTLEKQLQYYCVPEVIMKLKEFPMTDRGKIDKKELVKIALEQYKKIQGKK